MTRLPRARIQIHPCLLTPVDSPALMELLTIVSFNQDFTAHELNLLDPPRTRQMDSILEPFGQHPFEDLSGQL